jgi:hypothetical protein
VITQDSPVIVEPNPLHLLVEPVTDWNVEVGDFAVVERVTVRRVVEGVFIV